MVVSESYDVIETARESGAEAVDLRELLRGSEDEVDFRVASWRTFLDVSKSPTIFGIPVLASLRSEITWELLIPYARARFAARRVAADAEEILTDVPRGCAREAGLLRGAREAGSSLESCERLAGDCRSLPRSHGRVAYDDYGSLSAVDRLRHLSKLAAFRWAGSQAVRSVLEALRPGLGARPKVAYGHSRTLGVLPFELARDFRLVLWPWGLPPFVRKTGFWKSGIACAPYPERASLDELLTRAPEDWDPERLAVECAAAACRFPAGSEGAEDPPSHRGPGKATKIEASGTPPVPLPAELESSVADLVRRYLPALARRALSASRVFERMRPSAAVVPSDTSLDFAPVVLAARTKGVPAIVVAHGIEGSRVPGDKRLADHCLVWSEAMAESVSYVRKDGKPTLWATGPLYGESISRAMPPSRRSVLFLSYSTRYNTAWDSWMNPELYFELLAEVLPWLKERAKIVGIKIHGSEDLEWYESLASRLGLGNGSVSLLQRGYVYEVLEDAGVVVGPFSTGLAEAYWLGSMPVCVNLTGGPLPPPFDGSTEVPIVEDASQLRAVLESWLEGRTWSNWSPSDWPKFAAFLGDPQRAARRSAEAVTRIARASQH